VFVGSSLWKCNSCTSKQQEAPVPKEVVKVEEDKSALSSIEFGPSMIAGAVVGVVLTTVFFKFVGPKIIGVKAQ
jgi:hypothetical protein